MPDPTPPQSSIVLYQTEDGRTRVECRFEQETLWLTQALIAELFQITVPIVNEHLKGSFAEGELTREAAALRRAKLEEEGEADTLKQLENEVKKLPAAKKPTRK